MKTFSIILLAVAATAGGDVLFEDDFSDGNYDGWTIHDTGATYTVNANGMFQLSYTGSEDIYSLAFRGDQGETMSTENYSVYLEQRSNPPTGKCGIGVRYIDAAGSGYVLYLNYQLDTFYILRYDSFYSYTMLGSPVGYTGGFSYATIYSVRYECMEDTLRARIWELGDDEPETWMIVRTDSTFFNNGCMDIESLHSSSGTDFFTEFDNICVTSMPYRLEASTWAGVKQSFR